MDTITQPETFVPTATAAARVGVPAAWLKAEAEAGRVPHLRANRRLLFNPDELSRALLDRARKAAEVQHVG